MASMRSVIRRGSWIVLAGVTPWLATAGEEESAPAPTVALALQDAKPGDGDKPKAHKPDRKPPGPKGREALLKKFDKDGDGKLSDEEKAAARKAMAKHHRAKAGKKHRAGRGDGHKPGPHAQHAGRDHHRGRPPVADSDHHPHAPWQHAHAGWSRGHRPPPGQFGNFHHGERPDWRSRGQLDHHRFARGDGPRGPSHFARRGEVPRPPHAAPADRWGGPQWAAFRHPGRPGFPAPRHAPHPPSMSDRWQPAPLWGAPPQPWRGPGPGDVAGRPGDHRMSSWRPPAQFGHMGKWPHHPPHKFTAYRHHRHEPGDSGGRRGGDREEKEEKQLAAARKLFDGPPPGAAGGDRPDRQQLREQMFKRFDKDGDGRLSDEEKAAARKAFQERRGEAKQRPRKEPS